MSSPSPHLVRRDERPIRYGSAMMRRFGWFYRILGLGYATGRIRFEDHSVERIQTASAKGPVVYVLLQHSVLDHLALNAVLQRRRLPLSVWANGAFAFYWQPVAEAWRDVFTRVASLFRAGRAPDPVRSGWLTRTVAEGHTVTVFLRHGAASPDTADDPLRAILEAQETLEHGAIQLVPVICVWDRAPELADSAVRDFLLGSREAPSLFTKLRSMYVGPGQPFLQVGEALDLAEFTRRASPDRRLESLRTLLRRFLKREGRVVRGPQLVPRSTLKQLVLDVPPMRRFAEEEARSQHTTPEAIQRKMSKEFDQVAASFSWPTIRFLSIAMRPVWTRVYSGYDIRPEDLERIRNASRQGTAVLIPCHKSHFDYLLLSWILFWDDLIVPHVVAGINLAIWPVHYFLRACGGFFIRRSFSGENIHAKVFSRYLRELLLHGYTVEFFIEGGRTRSGKLMAPRLGVLEMVLDAADAAPPGHEITLLPISIAYEQVAEEGAYRSELGGAEKTKESVGELVKARRLLRNRYGRVYLRVGEPLKSSEVVGKDWKALDADDRRDRLKAAGETIVHRIGESMVVLPTALVALALLAHDRQGITHADLMARLQRLRDLLGYHHALESDSLAHFDSAAAQALDRFIRQGSVRRLGEGDDRVWDIVPEQRAALEFHKNQVLHHLALPCLATACIVAHPEPTFTEADLQEAFVWLLHLLRREFIYDPEAPPAARLHEALDALVFHGAITRVDEAYTITDKARFAEVHGLLRSLLESYLLATRASVALHAKPLDAKSFTKDIQNQSDTWLARGTVTRPEAFSSVNLANATKVLLADGVVSDVDGKLVADVELAQAMAARIQRMVTS